VAERRSRLKQLVGAGATVGAGRSWNCGSGWAQQHFIGGPRSRSGGRFFRGLGPTRQVNATPQSFCISLVYGFLQLLERPIILVSCYNAVASSVYFFQGSIGRHIYKTAVTAVVSGV
jgi:hypothetical protein